MMEDIIIKPLNFNKICRVCLSECEAMYSIYSELLYEDNSEEESPYIYEILISISSIKVQADDGLPNMICTSCIDSANTSFKFQRQCNKSQVILDACISQYNELNSQVVEDTITCTVPDELSILVQSNETAANKNEQNVVEFALVTSKKDIQCDNDNTSSEGLNVSDSCILENCIDEDITASKVKLLIDDNDEYSEEDMKLVTTSLVVPIEENIKLKKKIAKKKEKAKQLEKNTKTGISDNGSTAGLTYYCRLLENGEKIYECNLCDKSYKLSNNLRIHMRNHTHDRPYVCNICEKDFKLYSSLIYHQRSHTGEQPYVCQVCGKRYRQSGTLTAHMRIHTGVRPFLCSICGRGFRQAPDLSYHMRTHTKEKPYMCNICGKTMSMQCHLVQHMRTHTGEKPYKCTECNKAFPSSTRLKRHTIIHTGLKPYTCDVCDKSFNRNSTLRVHSKIHTNERLHVCSVCNKGFIQAHALRSHIVTHSSELSLKQLLV